MNNHTQSGFSLIEIMIAVMIIGIIMAVGVTGYWQYAERARITTTKAHIKAIQQAMNLYKSDVGQYPKKLEDLVTRPSGEEGKKWVSPYLERIPNDPWGNELYYKVTAGGKHPFELYSYGKGGMEGAQEDYIDVWNL